MVRKSHGNDRRVNGLGHLTRDELDAVLTGAGLLKEGLRRVSGDDLLPFFRGELGRLETAAEGHLLNKGITIDGDEEDTQPLRK